MRFAWATQRVAPTSLIFADLLNPRTPSNLSPSRIDIPVNPCLFDDIRFIVYASLFLKGHHIMLRTFPAPSQMAERTWRLVGIIGFTLLVALAAKIRIDIGPVPFTMQPLVVLLAGMVLGWRDGLLSLLAYVAMIAIGLPLDARGLGTAALFGPTGGYLVGFVVAAGVVGFLTQSIETQKQKRGLNGALVLRWFAGLVGVAVIYLFGVMHLTLYTGNDFGTAWATGGAPFLIPDAIKALLAAGLTESIRMTLNRRKSQS